MSGQVRIDPEDVRSPPCVMPTSPLSAAEPSPVQLDKQASAAEPPPVQLDKQASVTEPPPVQLDKQASVAEPPPIQLDKQASAAEPPPVQLDKQASVAGPPPVQLDKQASVAEPPPVQLDKQASVAEPPPVQLDKQASMAEPPPVQLDKQASVTEPPPAHAPAESPVLAPAPAPAAAHSGIPEPFMYKNRLQEYTQKASIPFPVYKTINEGFQHSPRFRATVLVDGESYTSHNTFSHLKAAEQDVAKLALECISKKIRDEGCPLILEDPTFCKSILNEFAVKMNLERPIYNTVQSEGFIPVFISSLAFNGVSYTGDDGRSKKEAEQLAARAVIQSILGTSGSGTLLSEIIKSKTRLYVALQRVKDSPTMQNSFPPVGANAGVSLNRGQDTEVIEYANNQPAVAAPGSSLGLPTAFPIAYPPLLSPSGQLSHVPIAYPPRYEFKKPKLESSHETIAPQDALVPSNFELQFVCATTARRRNRKNKRKACKKEPSGARPPAASVFPLNEAPQCSVAQ